MSYFVFNGAKCKCMMFQAGGKVEKNNKVSSEKSDGIITINDLPKMNGDELCMSPLNPEFLATKPKPCACRPPSFIGSWVNLGICNTKLGRTTALLKDSIIMCPYGGVVCVTSPQTQVVQNKFLVSATSLDDFQRNLKITWGTDRKIFGNNAKERKYAIRMIKDNFNHFMGETIKSNSENAEQEEAESEKKKNTATNVSGTDEVTEEEDYMYDPSESGMCSGKCPKGQGGCMFKDPVPMNMMVLHNMNDSTALGKNMNAVDPEMNKDTPGTVHNNMRNIDLGDKFKCVPQYHHLISGNECLNKNKALVMLANFYGYDVNRSENGILLPNVRKKDSSADNATEEEKLLAVCTVMEETEKIKKSSRNRNIGSQLHQGPHTYDVSVDFKNNSNLIRVSPKLAKKHLLSSEGKVVDYEDQLDDDLRTMQEMFSGDLKNSCRLQVKEEDQQKYEQEKQLFFDMMDNLSSQIRANILKFPGGEVGIKNYYVSNDAFMYDIVKGKDKEEKMRNIDILKKRGNK